MQGRAGVKNVTVIRDCNGQEPTIVRSAANRVSTGYPQVFGLSVPMTGKAVAHEFPLTSGIRTAFASRRTNDVRRAPRRRFQSGHEPDLRKRLDTFGVEFSGLSGEAFADFARKERETLAPIVEKANIKPN